VPLHYGVVTLLEERANAAHATSSPALDRVLETVNRQAQLIGNVDAVIRTRLSQTAAHYWRTPGTASAMVCSALVLYAGYLALLAPGAAGRADGATVPALLRGAAAVIPLAPAWSVTVTPPAYIGGTTSALGDVEVVRGTEGSRLRVQFGDSTRTLAMPERPATVEVRFGDTRRLFALVPQPDSLPQVVLLSPAADSVYRDSTGQLLLAAQATDDFGLAAILFDVIVTSGEGERYDARRLSLGARVLRGERSVRHEHLLRFSDLSLRSGDIVHVRAVAPDRNPRAGRAPGVSDTRSFRIARASEYDSVAVDGAPPPPVDSSLMSQRMLLMLTERLQAQRARLDNALLVRESRKLAADQARLRRAVSAAVFQRFGSEAEAEHVHYEGDGHEHGVAVVGGRLVESSTEAARTGGETDAAIVAVNRPLLEAYNAMWDAGRELELAEPGAAIPHMQRALEAIQRARAAERLYLRGRVRPVVVDVARVRMAGRDTGQSSRRPTARVDEAIRARLDGRLLRAATRYATDGGAEELRDSLFVLRIDMLVGAPEAAVIVGEVIDALQSRGATAEAPPDTVTDALVRARRALMPVASYRGGVLPWSVP